MHGGVQALRQGVSDLRNQCDPRKFRVLGCRHVPAMAFSTLPHLRRSSSSVAGPSMRSTSGTAVKQAVQPAHDGQPRRVNVHIRTGTLVVSHQIFLVPPVLPREIRLPPRGAVRRSRSVMTGQRRQNGKLSRAKCRASRPRPDWYDSAKVVVASKGYDALGRNCCAQIIECPFAWPGLATGAR